MQYSVRFPPRQIDPPFDLDWFVDWFGISVEYRPLPASVKGLYIKDQYGADIVVNASLNAQERRWTLAHELGHHVYAFANVSSVAAYLQTYDHSSPSEQVCDKYAAEILMPEATLLHWADRLGHGITDETSALARVFDVSTEAMKERLHSIKTRV